ncbi:hypothetical protein POSPLADRAFT_1045123 [Postia placenta MAD-698-R-SB12]|uniref:NAD(P)-binding protein n=1 Tax=Postia placenta MAD-698-R-SB12 TaxID=670580 RepID=A0A1X6N5T0_9APHY|nr:hypothetical protein POSPLADRAFT_1045123 [Postia placenta MAD-698-R-SB12]OSX63981.1 hypothetical protein POSPLADRAFT_1045123 [Postia placenta MAD-698-R-SB12]
MGSSLSVLQYIPAVYRQSFPPKPQFTTEQMPDLTGQVMIVTGVYMATRSKARADTAIRELKEQTGKEAIFLELDLASLRSVRKAAEEFRSKEQELHVLFNNAGVSGVPIEWTTEDGYDFQFGINVLGHFLFTQLLITALAAGSRASPDHHARIVTCSSFVAYFSGLDWETLIDSPKRRKLNIYALYGQSKLAATIMARELAKRYAEQGIISLSVNPGNIRTEIRRYAPALERKFSVYPADLGALTQLWAGTMPEPLNYNGHYLVPWARFGDKCRSEVYDDEIGERLWKWLEEQVYAK